MQSIAATGRNRPRLVREAFGLAEKAHRELETRPTFSTAVLDVLEPPLETNGSD